MRGNPHVLSYIDRPCAELVLHDSEALLNFPASVIDLNNLLRGVSGQHNDLDLADIRNSLKSTMWRLAGVVRDEHGLEEALQNISHWSRYVLSYQFKTELGWELQNMLTVSRLIVEGALNRRETRGSHNRSDYPDMAEPAEHTIFRLPE